MVSLIYETAIDFQQSTGRKVVGTRARQHNVGMS